MESRNEIIKIEHLNKSFGEVRAVQDLSLSVRRGELFAFLGVNGAGKSTTISILCGQLAKDSGEVTICGETLAHGAREITRKLGVVFQNSVLDQPLTVRDNLKSRAALYGITGKAFEERMQELAHHLDFADLLNRTVGKLSGAVGTYSNIDPFVEEYVCEKLGIKAARLATQVIQRDRHADYLTTIAIIGSSLEKMATEIRNLQRTDIREAEEYFAPGQKGSSAMPHKRNPITCEKISGMARLLRGYAVAALEDVTLWHERDISHSSVERVILPDATIALDHMLRKFINIVDKLLVYPDAMIANMNKTGGLIYSQNLLIALVSKGVLREDAYKWVQRNAMARWLEGADFKTNVEHDEDIKKYLTDEEIEHCFDPMPMLRNVDLIMARFGL